MLSFHQVQVQVQFSSSLSSSSIFKFNFKIPSTHKLNFISKCNCNNATLAFFQKIKNVRNCSKLLSHSKSAQKSARGALYFLFIKLNLCKKCTENVYNLKHELNILKAKICSNFLKFQNFVVNICKKLPWSVELGREFVLNICKKLS